MGSGVAPFAVPFILVTPAPESACAKGFDAKKDVSSGQAVDLACGNINRPAGHTCWTAPWLTLFQHSSCHLDAIRLPERVLRALSEKTIDLTNQSPVCLTARENSSVD